MSRRCTAFVLCLAAAGLSLMTSARASAQVAAGTQGAPTLRVAPESALVDVPLRISVAGLGPRQHAVIGASTRDTLGQVWRAWAEFAADEHGALDLATSPALTGTYADTDAMGLLRSMVRDSSTARRTPAAASFAPRYDSAYTIRFTLEVGGQVVQSADVRRSYLAAGVRVRELRENGVVGTLFVPPHAARTPAVLVLGGSEGGMPQRQAALIAAHGFSSLALAYFGPPTARQALVEIPLEDLERGLNFLRSDPDVDSTRVAVMGSSKGAELALLVASAYPDAIAAVIAVAPSDVVWQGLSQLSVSSWTYHGAPLQFVPFSLARAMAGGPMRLIDFYEPRLDDPAYSGVGLIPVERCRGPILFLSGRDDQVWPSARMAARAEERLRQHGFRFPVVNRSFEGAGHMLFTPFTPVNVLGGGTPEANYHAGIAAWRVELEFLAQHLGR